MSFHTNRLAAAIIAIAGCVLIPAVASATGTINIQHKNGTNNTYDDVTIKVFSGSLFLTSHDGEGTIVVTRAACAYQGRSSFACRRRRPLSRKAQATLLI